MRSPGSIVQSPESVVQPPPSIEQELPPIANTPAVASYFDCTLMELTVAIRRARTFGAESYINVPASSNPPN